MSTSWPETQTLHIFRHILRTLLSFNLTDHKVCYSNASLAIKIFYHALSTNVNAPKPQVGSACVYVYSLPVFSSCSVPDDEFNLKKSNCLG